MLYPMANRLRGSKYEDVRGCMLTAQVGSNSNINHETVPSSHAMSRRQAGIVTHARYVFVKDVESNLRLAMWSMRDPSQEHVMTLKSNKIRFGFVHTI